MTPKLNSSMVAKLCELQKKMNALPQDATAEVRSRRRTASLSGR